MNETPYLQDILSQADVLEAALRRIDLTSLESVRKSIDTGRFDRIVITGMGASLYGAYPAWLLMAQSGLPAILVDTAELVHSTPGMITSRTLLWAISQSGRSAELQYVLDSSRMPSAALLLALTNDFENPLARSADVVLPIDAPAETTVSTRTYLNSLAITQLAALVLAGKPVQSGLDELYKAASSLKMYLSGWRAQVDTFSSLIGVPNSLFILGRGPSMAAAQTGALIQGEASKFPAAALHAAEYRHGPMEMINPDLTVLILAGEEKTAGLNRQLCQELIHFGARAFWVAAQPDAELPTLPMPPANGLGLPIVEIAPMQILTLALAEGTGVQAGKFLFSGKVTTSE